MCLTLLLARTASLICRGVELVDRSQTGMHLGIPMYMKRYLLVYDDGTARVWYRYTGSAWAQARSLEDSLFFFPSTFTKKKKQHHVPGYSIEHATTQHWPEITRTAYRKNVITNQRIKSVCILCVCLYW